MVKGDGLEETTFHDKSISTLLTTIFYLFDSASAYRANPTRPDNRKKLSESLRDAINFLSTELSSTFLEKNVEFINHVKHKCDELDSNGYILQNSVHAVIRRVYSIYHLIKPMVVITSAEEASKAMFFLTSRTNIFNDESDASIETKLEFLQLAQLIIFKIPSILIPHGKCYAAIQNLKNDIEYNDTVQLLDSINSFKSEIDQIVETLERKKTEEKQLKDLRSNSIKRIFQIVIIVAIVVSGYFLYPKLIPSLNSVKN
jgi:hypothetical protein